MYLFFDTETTGLPLDWKAPVTDLANWPRVIQLAFLLHDERGNHLDGGDFIIKPDGFTIPADASSIHGITTEKAERDGIPLPLVLEQFTASLDRATYLVAHNIAFDEKVLGAEYLRHGLSNPLPARRGICTMERSVDYCALPGRRGYKWPRLVELHRKLFGTGFEKAHDAAADIRATARCFWELKRLRVI
ncbi:MAG: 3'-5' exonuclease [Odoribacteraceae bacterium]|jgi:DNA polymerase III epsilon subunit-like protein|nr:3'-5' exonuclease [Odoribacteraceae bacterium]